MLTKPKIYDITEAIKDERSYSEKNIIFIVKDSKILKDVLRISLNLEKSKNAKIDEDLEGCKVWWVNEKNKNKGGGEVLSIDIEAEVINLRFFKGKYLKKKVGL